jgi:serine protease AprX
MDGDGKVRSRKALPEFGRTRGRLGRVGRPRAPAILLLLALLVGLAPGSISGAAAATPRRDGALDAYLRNTLAREPSASIPVLIHRASKTAALAALRAHGGRVHRELDLSNIVAADVPAGKLEALAREPGVTRISFDPPMKTQSAPDPDPLQTAYPFAVQATALWTGTPSLQGTGVTVAVLDSGVDEHEDFKGATSDGTRSGIPRLLRRVPIVLDSSGGAGDDNGHGTWVTGIIGGRGWNSSGRYVGVAPDVSLIGIKVSDKDGVARASDVIHGIEWAVRNKDFYNIRVLNLSLLSTVAESYTTNPLNAAVELAWLKGLAVVVAAGNGGPDTMQYAPANDPYVITVGATDDMSTRDRADDRLAWFSSYGHTQDGFAKPDLVAPGRRIVSTQSSKNDPLALQYPTQLVGDSYIRLSGTSAAAPVVSGVVAQLLQARPELTPDQVKWLLVQTAESVRGAGTGAGYPNTEDAVKYSGTVERANRRVVPNNLVAKAGCATLATCPTRWGSVSWDSVSWDSVSWESVSWDSVAWDSVSWDSISWDSVAAD